jgi:uncharacterized NAD(P)/FAD-binding protein YdhS
MSDRPCIAVIGGGFSGVAFAVHLARAATRPLHIAIVEPRAALGEGIAYGDAADEHRINVPSDKMEVFGEDPLHFTRWLQQNGEFEADPEALTDRGHHYSKRRVFGRYMAELLRETAAANPSGSEIEPLRTSVVDLAREGDGWGLGLAEGEPLAADVAVVCASHATPEFRWPLVGDGAGLVRDPWDRAALAAVPAGADVVIAGTGLTMADTVVSLRRRGHRGRITAIARRALLPRVHTGFDERFEFLRGAEPPASARTLLHLARRRVAEAEALGLEWRAVLDALRCVLPRLWSALPPAEQQRAARVLRPWWDVHRFRMAPQVAAVLDEAQAEGALRIAAGRIDAIRREGGRWRIDWRPRGAAAERLACDAFINCTGPNNDLSMSPQPFFRSLFARGFGRPDAFRVGLDVDGEGCLLDAAGHADPRLRAAGPLARAAVAEVTGVPEASLHARRVAESVALCV